MAKTNQKTGKRIKFYGKHKKTQITFDSEERREYLTGFQKRKSERKIAAKELLKIQEKEEKIRLKQKRKDNLEKLMESQGTVPEVEHLLTENTVTYELPQQVVNITTFDAKQVSGSLGMSLGHNTDKSDHKSNESVHKSVKTVHKSNKKVHKSNKSDHKSNKKVQKSNKTDHKSNKKVKKSNKSGHKSKKYKK